MSIKNCQAIQKSCLDRESNAWFTLGSESESMVCDTSNFFGSTAGHGFEITYDRQCGIFLKFKESKEHIHSNYDMSIKNCQAIQRSCLDRESNAWFTLGSESESMVCDT